MAGRARAMPPPASDAPTRERIKAVAAELYVLHGHDGFSFGDVAAAIGTTRANIHHHFGNKRQLMAELIEFFADDAEARIRSHWTRPGSSFAERLAANVADLRLFYERFNRPGRDRRVWSPIARIRLDLPALGKLGHDALERIDRVYDACLREAVADAITAGELVAGAPVDDIARLLRVSLLACAPITQDSGSFDAIERLFAALERTILAAWGRRAGGADARAAGRTPGPAARSR